jgi:hypothetical protein
MLGGSSFTVVMMPLERVEETGADFVKLSLVCLVVFFPLGVMEVVVVFAEVMGVVVVVVVVMLSSRITPWRFLMASQ